MSAEARAATPSAAFGCASCGARLDRLHLEVGNDGPRCSFCGSSQDEHLVTAGAAAPASPRSADVGRTLRNSRKLRGQTLEQAARFTRIRASYLRDLEEGEAAAFEPFPGRVYARFFIREYADHLGLDPDPLVRGFDLDPGPAQAAPIELLARPMPRRAHPRRWAIGATLVLIALLIAGPLVTRDDQDPSIGADAGSAVPVAAGQPRERGHPSSTSADVSSLHAVIDLSRDCWILAVVDGRVALQETVPAGERVQLRASRSIELRLGDAGAAGLRMNGRPVPTGEPGAVADLAFVVRDGRIVRP
jgi:cytoskeleton protein RodZ